MSISSEMRSCAWSNFIPAHPTVSCPGLSVHLGIGEGGDGRFQVIKWSIVADLPARFFHVCPIAGCHVPLAHLDTLIQLMIDMLVFRRSQFFK